MDYQSDRGKRICAEQKALRIQARKMLADGVAIRDVAYRLNMSMYLVEHLMRCDLANALTREKFLRESLRLSRLMYRRLWAKAYDHFGGMAPREIPRKTLR